MTPLISIIIPIYNVKEYLEDCIGSITKQGFEDYEIILVDDGSTDNCTIICDEKLLDNNKIIVIHKTNGGLVSGRKAGAQIISGEYVANVDGDDGVSEKFFDKLESIIKRYNPDIIQFDSIDLINHTSVKRHSSLRGGFYNKERIKTEFFSFLIENENGRYFPPSVNYMLIKRALYFEAQMQVDNRIKIGEDGACTKPAVFKADSLYVLHECIGLYRINNESMTGGKKRYDIWGPKYVGLNLENTIDMSCNDFESQVYRYVVHNLFIAGCSQFYSSETYKEVISYLEKCLLDEYYKKAIRYCRYNKKYIKGIIAKKALEKKLYKILFIASLFMK